MNFADRVLYFLFLALNHILKSTDARQLQPIYWNSSNPLFTDNSKFAKNEEINVEAAYIKVYPMDTMNILCPQITKDRDKYENLIIHQVTDLSFINCELDSRSQIFLMCAYNNHPTSHQIVFRPFSPLPNGFEYYPGRSYYLITTSNGSYEGLNNTKYGLCLSKNVRLRIDVQPNTEPLTLSTTRTVTMMQPNVRLAPVDTALKNLLNGANKEKSHGGINENGDKSSLKQVPEVVRSSNDSMWFAERYGLDLKKLEYVRQLAKNGMEGDFSFKEAGNQIVINRDLANNRYDFSAQTFRRVDTNSLSHPKSDIAKQNRIDDNNLLFGDDMDVHYDYVVHNISGKVASSSWRTVLLVVIALVTNYFIVQR